MCSVQYATPSPNTICFTSHIFAHLCLHLSVQAANKCLKTYMGLPITSNSAAKSKWLQHNTLSNYKLGMMKLTGIRHKHHKQEVAACVEEGQGGLAGIRVDGIHLVCLDLLPTLD
jgi:hypothetical protein